MIFQSCFILMTVQHWRRPHPTVYRTAATCRRDRSTTPPRRRIRDPVIMMDEESEARAAAGYEPLQHLEITVGVPEGRDGPPSDPALDADRLPLLVIDEVQGRKLYQQLRLLIPMSSPQTTRDVGLGRAAVPSPRSAPIPGCRFGHSVPP